MKKIQLCFDMDGTIADLYGYENWLPLIRSEKVEPYEKCQPVAEYNKIVQLLNILRFNGKVEVIVISWSAMNGKKEYNKKVRKAKKFWLRDNKFPYDKLHVRKYGYDKKELATANAILFDDNREVRESWTIGKACTEKEIITMLEKLEREM